MGYAQDFFAQREGSAYFNGAPDVKLYEWMEAGQIRHHLSVQPDETFAAFVDGSANAPAEEEAPAPVAEETAEAPAEDEAAA